MKHIKTVSNGEVYEYIYKKLRSIGYELIDVTLSPVCVGIPQNRERVFFICVRKDIVKKNTFEKILTKINNSIKNVKMKDIILEKKQVDKKYSISDEIKTAL